MNGRLRGRRLREERAGKTSGSVKYEKLEECFNPMLETTREQPPQKRQTQSERQISQLTLASPPLTTPVVASTMGA